MPFSATRDAENYWRTRYGLPPDADNDKILKDKAARDIGPSAKSASRKKRLINNAFPSPRRRRWRIWLAVSLFVLSGAAYVALQPDDRDAAPSGPERISARPGSADGRVEPDTAAADFDVALDEFSSAREASVVALRGYLLTEGEGFRQEWLDATVRLQSAATALEAHSANWTDGQRLVEFVEAKRLLASLLAEERAVASIAGTVNRYPGLQLYTEDVRPALAEAQALCGEAMSAMLAVSSLDEVGPVGPFATFRGELENLKEEVGRYIVANGRTDPPASASEENFSAMRSTLVSVHEQVPQDVRPQIERLISLLGVMEEKLGRIIALRADERWDYARYAFETRILPLAGKLEEIAAGWNDAK
ncbi:MAG: hypothetical protein ABJL17_16335 [Parvibaculum sp.]|uniref:hypothetical protein n=1 Tax=Parvibaculum sp. TaxID=2024848 RepID=UPI003265FD38